MEKQKICEKERKKLEELRCKQEEDSIAEYNAMVEFKLNDDGESYTLIKCALDENWIRIGDTHNGLPVTSIGDRAFLQRCFLMNVTIPNSVTSIGSHAFANCMGLRSIAIPSSVTSIGRSAFIGCKNLTSIVIPSSVTSIGDNVFEDSKNLEYIYCFDNFRKIEGIRKAGIKRRAVLYYRETKPKIKLFRRYWHIDDGCAMEWW